MSDEPAPPVEPPVEPTPSVIVDDDTPLPAAEDLQAAVAAEPEKKADKADKQPIIAIDDHDDDHDEDLPKPKRPRRFRGLIAVLALAALAIGTLVLLGHLNADRYVLACEPDKVVARHGRGFPPWGTRELTTPELAAVTIPADAECTARETDDPDELAGWFLDLLVERADKALLAHDPLQAEGAAAQLQQALLLTRSPERRDQRHKIEHMLGDVDYWRATAKLGYARTQLLDAAKQFDTAGAAVPTHAADAAKQAAYARRIADQLAGSGATPSTAVAPAGPQPEAHSPAPPGVALPVEPTRVQGQPLPLPATATPSVPSGGVLL